MPLLVTIIISISVFVTSLLSGVFGTAGGMILMVVLLALLPVSSAIFLQSTIQLVSNFWRCFLWRRHIVWGILPWYGLGIAAGFAAAVAVGYVPDRAVAFLIIGIIPLLSMAAGPRLRLDISNRAHASGFGAFLTFIQMTGGVIGPLLDLLYVNAPLTRQQIVATKAFTQTVMHFLRMTYFGAIIPVLMHGAAAWPPGVTPEILGLFFAISVAGTSCAALILHRMDDKAFKSISRYIIIAVSLYCVANGLYLLMA